MRNLFICTKPYQYLMCRLIVESYGYTNSELIVLNHFKGAHNFVNNLQNLKTWSRVYFVDDTAINEFSSKLTPIRKFFFYRNWQKLLPLCVESWDGYNNLYLAHEGVATEYGIMRKFYKQKKSVVMYEEGVGNYINVNEHQNLFERLLKEKSHLLGIPGNYLGRLRYVDKILIQRPYIITNDGHNPIREKVVQLPMPMSKFLLLDNIKEEMKKIFPELNNFLSQIKEVSKVSILLGESFNVGVSNYNKYMNKIINLTEQLSREADIILVKQHPGDNKKLELKNVTNKKIILVPKDLPIELLYIEASKKLKLLKIFTFGSTAVINLYNLFSNQCKINITMFIDKKLPDKYSKGISRFRKLVPKFGIKYSIISI